MSTIDRNGSAHGHDGKFEHKQAGEAVGVDLSGPDFSGVDERWRAACEEYATRYAPAPTTVTLNHPSGTDYRDHRHAVPAADLEVGQRLVLGRLVTEVNLTDAGVVEVRCDGRTGGRPDLVCCDDDQMLVHDARVDLTDPDWFEFEAIRITAASFAERYPNGAASQDVYDAVSTEVRRRLTHVMQPTNLSPLHVDDVRASNGRAKVGDDVIFSSPRYGDSAYRVIGKLPVVDITGHDGTQVTWAENGEVEYVIQSIETGHQSTSSLRGHGWRRAPAPDDHGFGAQAITFRR